MGSVTFGVAESRRIIGRDTGEIALMSQYISDMLGYKPYIHGYDNFSCNDQETKTKILVIVDH